MLVLSRKVREEIVIGDNVVVTVLECKDGQVRLGISAPRDVTVLRRELADSVAVANHEAEALRVDVSRLPGRGH